MYSYKSYLFNSRALGSLNPFTMTPTAFLLVEKSESFHNFRGSCKQSECGMAQLSPFIASKFVSPNESRAWFVQTNPIEVPWKRKKEEKCGSLPTADVVGAVGKTGEKRCHPFLAQFTAHPTPCHHDDVIYLQKSWKCLRLGSLIFGFILYEFEYPPVVYHQSVIIWCSPPPPLKW